MQGIEWKEDVEKAVDEIVEHRFKAGKIKKIPLIGLISENLTYHIKYLLTKEVIKHIDEKKDSFELVTGNWGQVLNLDIDIIVKMLYIILKKEMSQSAEMAKCQK